MWWPFIICLFLIREPKQNTIIPFAINCNVCHLASSIYCIGTFGLRRGPSQLYGLYSSACDRIIAVIYYYPGMYHCRITNTIGQQDKFMVDTKTVYPNSRIYFSYYPYTIIFLTKLKKYCKLYGWGISHSKRNP